MAGEKSTWPGKKQVVRIGAFERDVIQLDDEPPPPDGRPLLAPVMRGGEIAAGARPPLVEIRERAAASLTALPEAVRALHDPAPYPVAWSERLVAMRRAAVAAHGDPASS